MPAINKLIALNHHLGALSKMNIKKNVNVGTIGRVNHGKRTLNQAIIKAISQEVSVSLPVNAALFAGKAIIQETDISSKVGQYEEQLRIILLSWNIAKAEGLNEAAAIRKVARKIRDRTKLEKLKGYCKDMLKCKSDSKVVESVKSMQKSLDKNGLIFTGKEL